MLLSDGGTVGAEPIENLDTVAGRQSLWKERLNLPAVLSLEHVVNNRIVRRPQQGRDPSFHIPQAITTPVRRGRSKPFCVPQQIPYAPCSIGHAGWPGHRPTERTARWAAGRRGGVGAACASLRPCPRQPEGVASGNAAEFLPHVRTHHPQPGWVTMCLERNCRPWQAQSRFCLRRGGIVT